MLICFLLNLWTYLHVRNFKNSTSDSLDPADYVSKLWRAIVNFSSPWISLWLKKLSWWRSVCNCQYKTKFWITYSLTIEFLIFFLIPYICNEEYVGNLNWVLFARQHTHTINSLINKCFNLRKYLKHMKCIITKYDVSYIHEMFAYTFEKRKKHMNIVMFKISITK